MRKYGTDLVYDTLAEVRDAHAHLQRRQEARRRGAHSPSEGSGGEFAELLRHSDRAQFREAVHIQPPWFAQQEQVRPRHRVCRERGHKPLDLCSRQQQKHIGQRSLLIITKGPEVLQSEARGPGGRTVRGAAESVSHSRPQEGFRHACGPLERDSGRQGLREF